MRGNCARRWPFEPSPLAGEGGAHGSRETWEGEGEWGLCWPSAAPSSARCAGTFSRVGEKGSGADDLLGLGAEAVYAEVHDVAGLEEALRFHAEADAGGGAGAQDVAGFQGDELRDV